MDKTTENSLIARFEKFRDFVGDQLAVTKVTEDEIKRNSELFASMWNTVREADEPANKGEIRAVDAKLTAARKILFNAISEILQQRKKGGKHEK